MRERGAATARGDGSEPREDLDALAEQSLDEGAELGAAVRGGGYA